MARLAARSLKMVGLLLMPGCDWVVRLSTLRLLPAERVPIWDEHCYSGRAVAGVKEEREGTAAVDARSARRATSSPSRAGV